MSSQLVYSQESNISVSDPTISLQTDVNEVTVIEVTVSNTGDADLTYDLELQDIFGNGPSVVFTKANYANWISASSQDRISDNVWIARGDSKSLFNAKSETTSDNNSPADTEWALGEINDLSAGYSSFKSAHGGNPQSLIGTTATLHTITDDEYYELDFTSYTGGNSGGGFSYIREQMLEYVTVTGSTSGTIVAGADATFSLTIGAVGLASGTHMSSVVISSNDPDEPSITIPITLEINEASGLSVSPKFLNENLASGDASTTQVFTIENTGESELTWSTSIDNKPDGMTVSLDSYSGSVGAGLSTDITVTFGVNEAEQGTYEWPVVISSNDPNNAQDTVLIVFDFNGIPIISIEEVGEFDQIFVGTTTSSQITLTNEGTAPLIITDISSNLSVFTPLTTTLEIAPDEFKEVTVSFAPTNSGLFEADLTILSNDSDQPSIDVAVEARAIHPPVINVNPTSIVESFDQGEVKTKTIEINNDGLSDLEWSVALIGRTKLQGGVSFEKADYADISLEENQDRISADVWITRGDNEPLFNVAEGSSYDSESLTVEWALGESLTLTPEDYTSHFQEAVFYSATELPGKTLSLHLIEEDRYFDLEIHSWTSNSNGGGFSYTRTEIVNWIESDVVENDVSGIGANGSDEFEVNIYGGELYEGNYEGSIIFYSNDPLDPETEVSINFTVSGTPDISTTPTTALASDVIVGSSGTFLVPIINDGTSVLEISDITVDNSVFVVSEASLNIPPKTTYQLEVGFIPLAIQTYTADLTITSNDPVLSGFTIGLTGEGIDAPQFDVSEFIVYDTVSAGSTDSKVFSIINNGNGTLQWQLESVFFEKEDHANIALPENQDRISDEVWMTRGNAGPIFNYYESTTWIEDPTTIEWGYGATNNLISGDYFLDLKDDLGGLSSLPGETLSLHTISDDRYYDLTFQSWTSNEAGGGFSYMRREASPWLAFDAVMGSVSGVDSEEITATFNAENLSGGDYEFSQVIESNDPSVPSLSITFKLNVTGTPDISVDLGSDSVRFDNQAVGLSANAEMVITNIGDSTLNVSDILFDNAVFGIDETSFVLKRDESKVLQVAFTPTAAETYKAGFTIVSDDPDEPSLDFGVRGTGFIGGDLDLDNASLNLTILSGGSRNETITITNNGQEDASWEFVRAYVEGQEDIFFEKESFSDISLPENQDRISDVVWITRGERAPVFNYYESPLWTDTPTTIEWGDGETISLTPEDYFRDLRDDLGGLSSLPGETLSLHTLDEDRYFDLEFETWVSDENGGGFSYTRTEVAIWVTPLAAQNGSLGAGASEDFSFSIDASDLPAGEYAAVIELDDDGVDQEQLITINLTVLGLAELSIENTDLDFGEVFVSGESTEQIELINTGTATLNITDIVSDQPIFEVETTALTIAAGDSEMLNVTFKPNFAQSYTGTLSISSDDPDNPIFDIDLTGSGVNPPEISVDMASLDQTLLFGNSGSQTITIENTGAADLEWNLRLDNESVFFSKADYADWTLEENQDRITENVWITRQNQRGIYNIAVESIFDRDDYDSPLGTQWYEGTTSENLDDYGTWNDAADSDPFDLPGKTLALYLEEDDYYFDVLFHTWTSNGAGGGFSYTRTPVFAEYKAVTFSAKSGVLAPGESQELTVFFNPLGTFSGYFSLPLQIESNDPAGAVDIPLSLNINGLIVSNPIGDQVMTEGFVSQDIDISGLFTDAQGDALTYEIESSDETVVTVGESGETLTITEVGTGTSIITITAEDGKGDSDTYEFTYRVLSEVFVWDGTEWNNATPPTEMDNAEIAGDYTFSLDGSFEVNNLEVATGFVLTVDDQNTLIVNGDLTNNGDLIIESGSSLLTFDGSAVSGNAIEINRNTRYADGKYSFVGSPVEQNAGATAADLGHHVYTYDETQSADESDLARWVPASPTDQLVPGKGYTQSNKQLITFEGVPNTGTISYSGGYTYDGWHMVSNPYAAAIVIDEFIDENLSTTTGSIYIWDDNNSQTSRGSNDDYIVANKTAAIDINASDGQGPNSQSRWNGHIGSAQGFFVQLDGAAGDITFTESMRVSGKNGDGNFFREAEAENALLRLNLTHTDGLIRQAIIGWNEEVSNTDIAQGYDAKVFSTNADYLIYTSKANTPLAIQTVNSGIAEIPIGFNVAEAGTYTIAFAPEHMTSLPLYLSDLKTGEHVSVHSGSYSFETPAGQFADRFVLTTAANVLALDDHLENIYTVNKTLHIETLETQSVVYRLYDLSGMQVHSAKVAGSAIIDLSNLASGVYIVSDGIESKKIIIK